MKTMRRHGSDRERACRRASTPQRSSAQRGVALITVLIAIAITLVISNEFGTTTNIDMIAAANYRDQMRAHFLARSAQNLAELVIRIQQRIDNIKELQRSGPDHRLRRSADARVLRRRRGGAGRDRLLDRSDVKGLGADIGTCGIDGRSRPRTTRSTSTARTTTQRRPTHQERARRAGVLPGVRPGVRGGRRRGLAPRSRAAGRRDHRLHRHATRCASSDRGTTEDYGYESLKDRYQPKNNYLDTLGELKLVRGVDDRFWTLFGNAFTVYGGCKINLVGASRTRS